MQTGPASACQDDATHDAFLQVAGRATPRAACLSIKPRRDGVAIAQFNCKFADRLVEYQFLDGALLPTVRASMETFACWTGTKPSLALTRIHRPGREVAATSCPFRTAAD